MRRLLIRVRGETLLEVLIAIVILTGIFGGIFGLLLRASAMNTNVVNRTVALNIAREGIEAVRNVRDTNWLKYSGDRRKKWLCLDMLLLMDTETALADTLDACKGERDGEDLLVTPGVYTIEFMEGTFFLSDGTGEREVARYLLTQREIPSVNEILAEINEEKETLPDDEIYRLYEDTRSASEGRFFHYKGIEDNWKEGDPMPQILPFYRRIYLLPEAEGAYLDSRCTEEGCPQNVRLRVLVRVQWAEDDQVRTVDLETYLYDFLGRETY